MTADQIAPISVVLPFKDCLSRSRLQGHFVIQSDPLPTLEILGDGADRRRVVDLSGVMEGEILVHGMGGGVTAGFGIRGHYQMRGGELAPVSFDEAADLLDPPGAPRRAYGRRVQKSGLTQALKRVPMALGHGYQEMEIAPWRGAWAAIEKVTAKQIWVRAATWQEALEVGAETA